MVTIIFPSQQDYQSFLDRLIADSSYDVLTRPKIESAIKNSGTLEGLVEEPEIISGISLNVITKMNSVFIGNAGRTGVSNKREEVPIAAEYFLKLLDGKYIDEKGVEQKVDYSLPNCLERALCAFLDYTDGGHDFLYHEEPNIPLETKKAISKKLLAVFNRCQFTSYNHTLRIFAVLTGMNQDRLPSAQGKFPDREMDGIPFEEYSALINGPLKRETEDYFRSHCRTLLEE